MPGLYGDIDMAKVLYGERAIHVPAWMAVQDAGDSLVSFVGASRVLQGQHPMRFGSDKTHQLFIGELVLRPHVVYASNDCEGYGLAGLATNPFDMTGGDIIIDNRSV